MSRPQIHGRAISLQHSPDDSRSNQNGAFGDANMQTRGLSFGKTAHGEAMGALDAVQRKLVTSVAAGNVYTVQHDLQRVPGFVLLIDDVNIKVPASHYHVKAWEKNKWTASTIRVRVIEVSGAGSLDGGQLLLMIGGS